MQQQRKLRNRRKIGGREGGRERKERDSERERGNNTERE